MVCRCQVYVLLSAMPVHLRSSVLYVMDVFGEDLL